MWPRAIAALSRPQLPCLRPDLVKSAQKRRPWSTFLNCVVGFLSGSTASAAPALGEAFMPSPSGILRGHTCVGAEPRHLSPPHLKTSVLCVAGGEGTGGRALRLPFVLPLRWPGSTRQETVSSALRELKVSQALRKPRLCPCGCLPLCPSRFRESEAVSTSLPEPSLGAASGAPFLAPWFPLSTP